MGKKKIEIEPITDERNRRVCFKKRRLGLFKKAIQLSILSNCDIYMKIYNKEDGSMIEYQSNENTDLQNIQKHCPEVLQYCKFLNQNYELVSELEQTMTRHGYLNQSFVDTELECLRDDGANMIKLFSYSNDMNAHKKRDHKLLNSPKIGDAKLGVKQRKIDHPVQIDEASPKLKFQKTEPDAVPQESLEEFAKIQGKQIKHLLDQQTKINQMQQRQYVYPFVTSLVIPHQENSAQISISTQNSFGTSPSLVSENQISNPISDQMISNRSAFQKFTRPAYMSKEPTSQDLKIYKLLLKLRQK